MLTTKQARENQEKYGFNELVEKYHADISGTV